MASTLILYKTKTDQVKFAKGAKTLDKCGEEEGQIKQNSLNEKILVWMWPKSKLSLAALPIPQDRLCVAPG